MGTAYRDYVFTNRNGSMMLYVKGSACEGQDFNNLVKLLFINNKDTIDARNYTVIESIVKLF